MMLEKLDILPDYNILFKRRRQYDSSPNEPYRLPVRPSVLGLLHFKRRSARGVPYAFHQAEPARHKDAHFGVFPQRGRMRISPIASSKSK